MSEPKRGIQVRGHCVWCERKARTGETYGPHEKGWDFLGICPECWDSTMADPDELEEETPEDGR